MKNWMFAVTRVAVLLGALEWCARAVGEGGPALPETPPVPLTPEAGWSGLAALFLLVWFTAVFALSVKEPADVTKRD